jgi:putative ABC transport system substrate-binding protein
MKKACLSSILIAVALVAVAVIAEAQQSAKVPRVGFLRPGPPSQDIIDALRQGLREFGYVEGQNIAIQYRWAEGGSDDLLNLAAELVQLKVNVIVASSTPAALAVKSATRTIPVVFTVVGDPVGSGLVASLARPGGNFTGLTNISFELDAKRLELLKEAVPKISRVAVLMNPDFQPHAQEMKVLKVFAQALRVELRSVEFHELNDFTGGVADARKSGANALLVMAHPFTFSYATPLAELATRNHLPAIAPFREFAESGGLMAYGANNLGLHRRAVYYVDRILKGTKPADLPVEQPTKFELVINLKGAKQIGVTIPQSVLFRADKVIK